MRKEELRAKKIADAKNVFAGHRAALTQYRGFQVLDWREPDGSSLYAVRIIFDTEQGAICIAGDLGEAIAYPSWKATLKNTVGAVCSEGKREFDERFFLGMCRMASAKYDYDAIVAGNEIRKQCPGIGDGEIERTLSGFTRRDGLKYLGLEERRILQKYDDYYEDWVYDAGRTIDFKVYAWLVAMKMAWEQLKGEFA